MPLFIRPVKSDIYPLSHDLKLKLLFIIQIQFILFQLIKLNKKSLKGKNNSEEHADIQMQQYISLKDSQKHDWKSYSSDPYTYQILTYESD